MAPIAFDTSSNDASLFHTGEHTNHATKETVKFFLSQEEQPQHVQQNQEPCQNSRESLQPEELLEVPQKENVQNQTFKVLEDHILDQCSPSQHTTQHEVPQQEDNKDNKERAMNINDIEETTDSHNLEEKLLRDNEEAVNVLKFQLQQVKEDICKLKSMKEKALKDPIQFVEDLRNGERVNPSSSDRSRSGRESSPDIVEFVHQKAQELGFKVPQNAIKSTRSKKKRINQTYMEAQPPPTLYMPDDDDETVTKEVMLLMDKIGNEPK
ncbi:4852_t:CDS:2, partial [Racocetra fulgida]